MPTPSPSTMTSEQAIYIPGLEVEYLTDSILVSGKKTYDYREQLKALGGEWDPATKQWVLPPNTDMHQIEIIPPPVRLTQKQKEAQRQHEAKERVIKALEESRTTGKYHWICCESCEVVSWSRGVTCCREHGSDGYSVRVMGRLYTGD